MKYTRTDKVFIDSNLWIYLAVKDKENSKHPKAVRFFERIADKNINTSIQVINEFHWVLLRKYKLPENIIEEKVNGILQFSRIHPINIETYNIAKEFRNKYKLSFWDSLIVSAAYGNGCTTLYSEDMHHGLIIEGKLEITNPLK